MKKILVALGIVLLSFTGFSQELRCRVQINYSQVKTTNRQIFQDLQRAITDFMNKTRWTNYVFAPEERIDCNILIIIQQFNGTDYFKGTIQVSSNRPVFNSSYTSPVLNLKERDGLFEFRYLDNQPIEFNERTFTGDLAYTLAFYAYLVIAMDFDTFAPDGGAPFYAKLKTIVANAQSSPSRAWKAMGTNRYDNRYYIARDMTDEGYEAFHQAMYEYHRQGLDLMADDMSAGRQGVLQALKDIEKLYRKHPQTFLIQMFLQAKRQEIINIFSEAPMPEAKQAAMIMKTIDPSNASKYDKMGSQLGQ